MSCLPRSIVSALLGAGDVSRTLSAISGPRALRAFSTATSHAADNCYDVVIVGGGMVGAAVAALLGANRLTSQLRVAVLDVKPQSSTFQPRPVPELRVSTITPGSIEVLRRAGAWEEVAAHSASFDTMQVWDASSPGFIRWDARDTGAERMGIVAENSLLQSALLAAAERSGGLTEFIWPAEVTSLRLPGVGQPLTQSPGAGAGASGSGSGGAPPPSGHGLAELHLSDGRVLSSRLVVAADGNASRIRSMAGLRTWGWGYGQRGLVATVETDEPSDTAWQRFLPTGPLALLPVRGGLSNIVWSTTPEAAQALEGLGPQEFAAAVNKALRDPPSSASPAPSSSAGPLDLLTSSLQQLGSRLGSGGGADPWDSQAFREPPRVLHWTGYAPRSFPLQLKQAGRFVLPRLVLVGDAAHAVHPMAGQGVNLGFGDARVLAEALAAAVETGSDPGDARMLADSYEAPRKRSVLAMVTAMDGVKRAFQVQAPGLAALRGVGLGLINRVGAVRNGIMQYAMLGQS